MKKILFFITRLGMGGTEKALVRVANALSERHEITILALFGGGILEKELASSIRIKHIFPCFIRGVSSILRNMPVAFFYRLFVHGCYDAEICFEDTNPSRHIMSASTNPNKFCWVHLNVGGTSRGMNAVYHREMASFRKIICVSEHTRRDFETSVGLAGKLQIAYTPIDIDAVREKGNLDVSFPENTYIAVGRLEKIKGFERLIDAISKLEQPDFKVCILGDGTQREPLQQRINELGLNSQVELWGNVNNPYPYIKKARGLVCASLSESFGFSIIEAMALKIPVLSTHNGGCDEILSTPELGILCENSREGLVEGIRRLTSENNGIDVEKAFQRAYDFSVEKCLLNLEQILES